MEMQTMTEYTAMQARIEQLEAALREIAGRGYLPSEMAEIASAALDQSSPPKASDHYDRDGYSSGSDGW